MGVWENIVCLQEGQKRFKDSYNDPDMLCKVNKADIAGMMESMEEYLRSYCGVVRKAHEYIIRKTWIVHVYGDYPKDATPPEDEMIARISHLSPNKNKLHDKQSAQSVKQYMEDYEIDNISIYDILYLSERTLACINITNGITPKGTAEGHIMLSIPDGWARIMSMQPHQKLRWLCKCLHRKPYWIWVPRPWPRIEGLILVEWHHVWHVVHNSCHSKGPSQEVWEGLWCNNLLPQSVHWQESTKPSVNIASVGQIRPAQQKISTSKERLSLRSIPGRNMNQC